MKDDILIFWHHVGREHGGLQYTKDIRKNDQDTIDRCLQIKEERWRKDANPHRFIKYDHNILVELPPLDKNDAFIIVYFIKEGLQFEYRPYRDNGKPMWIVDIVEIREIKPGVFCVSDLFIDLDVKHDGSYNVLDLDEFALAIELEVIERSQIIRALNSLNMVVAQLNEGLFPCKALADIKEIFIGES